MKKKYKELLEKFLAKNENDLEKMSRPRLQFPNLNIPTRLDQEIKPIGTERQKNIHARTVAETITRTAPSIQRIADPKRRQAVIEDARKDVIKQVKGSFGRGDSMGHTIPVANKLYGAALVGKEYSKYDPALEGAAKEKEAAKMDKYKNKYNKWKQELQSKPYGSTDYWNHLANKPKEPRKSPIPKTETEKLPPEAQIARGKAQDEITEHEAAHMAFGHIKNKYPEKYQGIMRHLMGSFSPEVQGALITATAKRYNPKSPHFYEEVVNHARDILVDQRMRDNFLRNTKGDQKLISGVKQGWNEVVKRAKKLTPEFGKSELNKSKEDIKIHPSQRKQFRQERRSFEGQDPLAQEIGNKQGVSNIGIETRRADPKQKGVFSHGYARIAEPLWHQQRAKKYHQQLLSTIQAQPKPKLTKSNINKAPKERLSGITTGKLKQLTEDHYHNPDTGLEVVPEAAHQEIARRAENKAPKMIADYKRKLKPQKPSGENPEDWFGKDELEKGHFSGVKATGSPEKAITNWIGGKSSAERRQYREKIKPISGDLREKALHRLHAKTEVRRNTKTGEREFLLHRGTGKLENKKGRAATGKFSSWTPYRNVAEQFDSANRGGVISQWVPESAIHHIPMHSLNSANYTNFNPEHEVLVSNQRIEGENVPTQESQKQRFIPSEDLNARISHRGGILNDTFKQYSNSPEQVLQNKRKSLGKSLEKALPTAPKVNLNPEHGKIIANAYENMKHDPNHPHVKAAYNALAHETGKQYQNLLNQGYKFSPMKPGMENPYKTSKDMHADIANNKHLWYFPTEQGYGSENNAPNDHPLLAPSKFKDKNGKVMPHNDVFRAVHDIMGHHLGGQSGFGPKGEHQAYLTHKKTYSPLAQKALASETLMQNSWVNFGPHAAHNRANPQNTIFAEQKAGLPPDNIINGRWHE